MLFCYIPWLVVINILCEFIIYFNPNREMKLIDMKTLSNYEENKWEKWRRQRESAFLRWPMLVQIVGCSAKTRKWIFKVNIYLSRCLPIPGIYFLLPFISSCFLLYFSISWIFSQFPFFIPLSQHTQRRINEIFFVLFILLVLWNEYTDLWNHILYVCMCMSLCRDEHTHKFVPNNNSQHYAYTDAVQP